jgi:hypothetical protein
MARDEYCFPQGGAGRHSPIQSHLRCPVAILVRTYEFFHHLLPRKIHSLPDVTAMVSDLMEDIWSSYGARN